MLNDAIVHADVPAEFGEGNDLVAVLRHQHHLETDGHAQPQPLLLGDHVPGVFHHLIEVPAVGWHAHDFGVPFRRPGGDIEPQVSQVGQHLIGPVRCQNPAVSSDRHVYAESVSIIDCVSEGRVQRGLTIADQTDGPHAHLCAVL